MVDIAELEERLRQEEERRRLEGRLPSSHSHQQLRAVADVTSAHANSVNVPLTELGQRLALTTQLPVDLADRILSRFPADLADRISTSIGEGLTDRLGVSGLPDRIAASVGAHPDYRSAAALVQSEAERARLIDFPELLAATTLSHSAFEELVPRGESLATRMVCDLAASAGMGLPDRIAAAMVGDRLATPFNLNSASQADDHYRHLAAVAGVYGATSARTAALADALTGRGLDYSAALHLQEVTQAPYALMRNISSLIRDSLQDLTGGLADTMVGSIRSLSLGLTGGRELANDTFDRNALIRSLIPDVARADSFDAALQAVLERTQAFPEIDLEEFTEEDVAPLMERVAPLMERLTTSGKAWVKTVDRARLVHALFILEALLSVIINLHDLRGWMKMDLEEATQQISAKIESTGQRAAEQADAIAQRSAEQEAKQDRISRRLQKKAIGYQERQYRQKQRAIRAAAKAGAFNGLGTNCRIVMSDAVSLREAPRRNGRVVGRAAQNTAVRFVGKHGRWALVRYLDRAGDLSMAWISSKYLLKVSPEVCTRSVRLWLTDRSPAV